MSGWMRRKARICAMTPEQSRARTRGACRALAPAIVAACALHLGPARSQAPDIPRPGPPRPLSIASPVEERLPDGLRVVLAQRRGVQLVTAQLVVLSGAEADPPGRAGLASMTAGLLVKGTARHDASELARAAESLGGALDSGAGWHQSSVDITVTVPKLDAALALVAEAVRRPSFAPVEITRLRAQALDDLKVAYSQPSTLASIAAQRMLFGAGAYGHSAGGTPQSLGRITRADVLRAHAAAYRPDNAVLVLSGDIDLETALRLARRHFGDWKVVGLKHLPAPIEAASGTPPGASAVAIDLPGADQATVMLAVALPPLGKDRATAAVLNAVLGGGFSSRLNQEIRIKRGLSYSADSSLDARPRAGSVRVVIQTKNESAAEVVGLANSELDRLIDAPVPGEELAARKAALIGDFSRSVETTAGLGAVVRSLVVAGRAASELSNRIGSLSAVSAEQVQGYAAAHLGASERRLAVAGDSARFSAALGARDPRLLNIPARAITAGRADFLDKNLSEK